MNFQLSRFIHDTKQYIAFDVVIMLVIMVFLAMLTSLGIYCAWDQIKHTRISRGAAAGLTPAPTDAELKAPR